jgi:5-enolpyruvylshikimate-3-phosphate synthase
MTGKAQIYAFLEKQPEFAHVHARASKSLSSRAGYNRAETKQVFELRVYLYGKDPLQTYTVLTKLSVRTYTTSSFITLVLNKG